jgi:hypothetical protein
MDTILIEEKQRLREIAFYILLGLLQLLFLWGLIQQVIFNIPWGTKPGGDIALIISNIGIFTMILLLFSIHLKTRITDKYISFRLFPFQMKRRRIDWEKIQKVKVIKYDGMKEYCGYGLKYMPGNDWAYTISGEYGIRIILKNGRKILIGTHKPREISQIFDDLKNRGIINLSD